MQSLVFIKKNYRTYRSWDFVRIRIVMSFHPLKWNDSLSPYKRERNELCSFDVITMCVLHIGTMKWYHFTYSLHDNDWKEKHVDGFKPLIHFFLSFLILLNNIILNSYSTECTTEHQNIYTRVHALTYHFLRQSPIVFHVKPKISYVLVNVHNELLENSLTQEWIPLKHVLPPVKSSQCMDVRVRSEMLVLARLVLIPHRIFTVATLLMKASIFDWGRHM